MQANPIPRKMFWSYHNELNSKCKRVPLPIKCPKHNSHHLSIPQRGVFLILKMQWRLHVGSQYHHAGDSKLGAGAQSWYQITCKYHHPSLFQIYYHQERTLQHWHLLHAHEMCALLYLQLGCPITGQLNHRNQIQTF